MSAKFSAFEKHREALREVAMRRVVYENRGMPKREAERKIEIMQEIADEYGALAEKERLL